MAGESIRLGEKWSQRVDEELEGCDYFLLLLSEQSAVSEMVTEEVRRAKQLGDLRPTHKPIILPIRVNFPMSSSLNYDLRGYLQRIQQRQWTSAADTPKILQEVLSLPSHRFLKFENPNTNTSFTEHNFWIKFQISNRTNEEKLYFLETGRPITDQVDLYVLKGEKLVQKFKNGDLIPFSEKSVQHRKAIFEIEIPAHTTYQYFIHLKSDGEVINLPLLLRTAENFINATAFEQMIFGFFYGILGLAAIIYLFFFFGIRNRSFLYYGLYVVFIGLMQFSLDGYFHQYILPNGGFFSDRAVLIFASISTIFLGKYTETFLEIKKYNLLILRGYHAVYLASILVLILLFLIPSALSICYPAANAIGFVVLILIISSLVSVYRNTKKIDGFFYNGYIFSRAWLCHIYPQ
jgi:hypothetical protein